MYGTAKDLNVWNYKIYSQRITLSLPINLCLDYFENKINTSKDKLIRWAIINVDDQKVEIHATFLSKEV